MKSGKEFIMFIKDETVTPPQKNIRISRSDALSGPYGPASAPVTGKYWAEGPTVLRTGSEWIVYFDKYREGKYGAVRSGDMGQWEDISEMVVFPKGARHGTVLEINGRILKILMKAG